MAYAQLLGFDARENEQDCKKNPLPEEVREQLLLRPEIECPFSVDPHIWPSHFLYYPQLRQLIGPREPVLIETDPDCRGGLWLDLARMQHRLHEHQRSAVALAIEVYADEKVSLDDFPSPLIYSQTNPSVLPHESTFLGYDVADSGFWSGLSNAGYSVDEKDGLRSQWQGHINGFGLLKTQEDAFGFRKLSAS